MSFFHIYNGVTEKFHGNSFTKINQQVIRHDTGSL